jgi:hypothetical protein
MAEKYNQEIERIKELLVSAYIRLQIYSEKIDELNKSDDLDGLEKAVAIREALLDRVELLKARIYTEISQKTRGVDIEARDIAAAVGFDFQKHYLLPSHKKLISE